MGKATVFLLLLALFGCGDAAPPANTTASPTARGSAEPGPAGHLADGFGYAGGSTGARYGGPAADDIALVQRTCVRVVDGDTIELDGGEKVRYIGIDTPETKHPRKPVQWMGKEATEANRLLVEGKRVGLEFDVEHTDKYGRTLAYVYVGRVMVNELLVKAGYAQVSTYPPNVKHVDRFVGAQREARESRRGLWGDGADPRTDPLLRLEGGEGAPATETAPPAIAEKPAAAPAADADTVYVTRTGEKYHLSGCQYLRQSRIPIARKDAVAQGYGPCSRCRP